MARRVTLDQLAAMIARGFEDVRREIADVRAIVNGHTATLDADTATLANQTAILDGHTSTLAHHTALLDGHTAILADHSHRLGRIERKLDRVVGHLDDHEVRIQVLEKRRGSRS